MASKRRLFGSALSDAGQFNSQARSFGGGQAGNSINAAYSSASSERRAVPQRQVVRSFGSMGSSRGRGRESRASQRLKRRMHEANQANLIRQEAINESRYQDSRSDIEFAKQRQAGLDKFGQQERVARFGADRDNMVRDDARALAGQKFGHQESVAKFKEDKRQYDTTTAAGIAKDALNAAQKNNELNSLNDYRGSVLNQGQQKIDADIIIAQQKQQGIARQAQERALADQEKARVANIDKAGDGAFASELGLKGGEEGYSTEELQKIDTYKNLLRKNVPKDQALAQINSSEKLEVAGNEQAQLESVKQMSEDDFEEYAEANGIEDDSLEGKKKFEVSQKAKIRETVMGAQEVNNTESAYLKFQKDPKNKGARNPHKPSAYDKVREQDLKDLGMGFKTLEKSAKTELFNDNFDFDKAVQSAVKQMQKEAPYLGVDDIKGLPQFKEFEAKWHKKSQGAARASLSNAAGELRKIEAETKKIRESNVKGKKSKSFGYAEEDTAEEFGLRQADEKLKDGLTSSQRAAYRRKVAKYQDRIDHIKKKFPKLK